MLSAEENVGVLIEAWKQLVGPFPTARIEHAGGVATMFAHIPLPFMNLSVLDGPVADPGELRNRLAVVKERAMACEFGSLLALCDKWAPADWLRVLGDEGFSLALNMTGMATDRLLPRRRASPGVEFRRVTDEAGARDIAMVNAQAYQMPAELFECICNLHLWPEGRFGYVGYAEGRAVTAAAAFPVAGTVYVAYVATLPEAQGKGYAEAAMRLAMERCQKATGLTRMTLHASDMGMPLYQAMGFEPGGRVVLLAASDGSAGH